MKRIHGGEGGEGRVLHSLQPCWKFILPHYTFKKSLRALSVGNLLKF